MLSRRSLLNNEQKTNLSLQHLEPAMSSQQVIWGSLIGGVVGRETLNVTLTSEKTFVIPSNLPPRRLKSKSGFESASQDPTPGADAPSTGIPRLPVSVSRHRGYVVGRDADCGMLQITTLAWLTALKYHCSEIARYCC